MARDTSDTTPLTKRDELIAWFAEGEKPRESFAVGTEHEKVPFYRDGNSPVPYEGEAGIRALLEGVARETGWEAIEDAGHLIGLAARVVEGGGNEILEHLLVVGHDQAVVYGHSEDTTLGGGAHLHQSATGSALHFEAVELRLDVAHLLLNRFGGLLCGG